MVKQLKAFASDNVPGHPSLLGPGVLAKNNIVIMPQPLYSPDLALKTEKIYERTAFCHNWGDKDCIAGRAENLTKKHISDVLQGLEKAIADQSNQTE